MKPKQLIACAVSFSLLLSVLGCILSPVDWSPDGKWIAHVHILVEESKSDSKNAVTGTELWIVSPATLERKRLMATSDTLSGPAWSPDSKALYVTQYSEKDAKAKSATLWRVGLDGQAQTLAKFANVEDTEGALFCPPSLSPDGRLFAVARDSKGIALLEPNGRIKRTLSVDGVQEIAWSPDGKWLLVTLDGGDQNPNVQFFDAQSSETFVLDVRFAAAAWLPDGKRIVALKRQPGDGGDQWTIVTMELAMPLRELASHPITHIMGRPLVVSRDGSTVYLAQDKGEAAPAALCALDLKSGAVKTVYETPGIAVPWSLSPDGKRLAFRESPRGDNAIHSLAGVLDLPATTAPLFLPVADKQIAAVIENHIDLVKKAASETPSADDVKMATHAAAHVERLLAAFRRDFPNSPLLAQCEKAMKDARAAVEKAGRSLDPAAAGPKW